MPDFDTALEAIAVSSNATRDFTLTGVHVNCDQPVVIVTKHAGFTNSALTSAQLKSFNERQQRGGGNKMSVDKLDADRIGDCKLFAAHVVTTLKNVCEADGAPSKVDKALVESFLLSLSKRRLDIFRGYTSFASDADNFTESPHSDPEPLGK